MLYIGTHRRAHRADPQDVAFGIYAFRQSDPQTWDQAGLAKTDQPGWLAFGQSGATLYAVNEVREMVGHAGGSVSAFALGSDPADLALLNVRPLPPMPCHCVVDGTGRYLLVATFGGGSVHAFPINDDGSLGEECSTIVHTGSSAHPKRQTSPHAHAVVLSPDNRFAVIPDLGTDTVEIHAFDSTTGQLTVRPGSGLTLPPLSGPRHAVFSLDGRHLYLVNEMSAELVVCTWDGLAGSLAPIQTVDLLPAGFVGLRSGAAIELHPEGDMLYLTTRSHGSSGLPEMPGLDQLICLRIDRASGLAEMAHRQPSGGGIPRSMTISPDGQHLYVGHQCSGTVVEFHLVDQIPEPTGVKIATPVPVCLLFAR